MLSDNRMDIFELRRLNLQLLIDVDFNGNQASMSEKTGIKTPQINRWLSTTAKEKRKITETSARSIEASCGKPSGWMDHENSAGDAGHAKTEDEQTILKGYRLSETPIKQFLLDQARTIIKNHRDKHTHPEATESDVQLNVMAQ